MCLVGLFLFAPRDLVQRVSLSYRAKNFGFGSRILRQAAKAAYLLRGAGLTTHTQQLSIGRGDVAIWPIFHIVG